MTARLTRTTSAGILLTERLLFGRPFVFTNSTSNEHDTGSNTVHIVGPDENQPGITDPGVMYLRDAVRSVCGYDLHRAHGAGLYCGAFNPARLCASCLSVFRDHLHLIWEDNTPEVQAVAPQIIARLRETS